MAKLTTTVFVRDREDRMVAILPGEDVPDWAAEQITNPHVWDGTPPAHVRRAKKEMPSGVSTGTNTSGSDEAVVTTGQADQPPPRSGKGSSKEAWAAYAQAKGVTVDEGMSREDIIAELETRDIIPREE